MTLVIIIITHLGPTYLYHNILVMSHSYSYFVLLGICVVSINKGILLYLFFTKKKPETITLIFF